MGELIQIIATMTLSASAMAATPNGKMLYQQNCASCHGSSGQGASAPKLAGDASRWPDRLFARAVLTGIDDHGQPLKGPMPHWKDSAFSGDHGAAPTKAEITAIQHYLKSGK